MSFDLKLSRKCDHRLFRQIRFLENDGKSVLLPTLLGSSANFQVWLNGNRVDQDSTYAGWDLVKDPASVYPGQKKILFRKKRKAIDDWVELSYYCYPNVCPKCSGFDLQFDYEYSNIGRPLQVINESKLVQDMEKIVLTIKGSSIYYPWYGTLLVSMIGSKQPAHVVKIRFQREVAEALDNLKSLQEKQESYQVLTDREFLYQIQGVSVLETDDPTLYKIFVRAQTQAGGTAEFERPLQFDQGFLDTVSEPYSSRTAF